MEIEALIILLFMGLLYFLPTIIASHRRKKNTAAIGLLNLFFGWSIIGWVIALIWATTYEQKINQI